jgi:hypothetical protein
LIPLPQIIAELIMALGAALILANVWALLRPIVRPDAPAPARSVSRGRALVNAGLGLVVFVWAFASFITRGS